MTTSARALASMTGFATASGDHDGHQWDWTLRAVNGKGLDLRFRLPPGLDRIEVAARALAGKRLVRGSVTANLSLRRVGEQQAKPVLNQAALETVITIAAKIAASTGAQPATVDGILAVRGVLETEEASPDEAATAALDKALEAGFSAALDALVSSRFAEGAELAKLLEGHLDTVYTLVGEAEALPGRTPEAIAERLKDSVAALLSASPQLDPERLHQEAVLAAAKADVREEIDRLNAHVGAAREMLQTGGAVGRDLNFLAQEFNREANTLCSKSNDIALTRIGLKLKGVIDQFREQVQNIE